jgi:hypothetical protein
MHVCMSSHGDRVMRAQLGNEGKTAFIDISTTGNLDKLKDKRHISQAKC